MVLNTITIYYGAISILLCSCERIFGKLPSSIQYNLLMITKVSVLYWHVLQQQNINSVIQKPNEITSIYN